MTTNKDENITLMNGATKAIKKERHLNFIAIDTLFSGLTGYEFTNISILESGHEIWKTLGVFHHGTTCMKKTRMITYEPVTTN